MEPKVSADLPWERENGWSTQPFRSYKRWVGLWGDKNGHLCEVCLLKAIKNLCIYIF